MENKLKLFENKEFGKIRVEIVDNKPYFNLNDVCNVLELSNPRQIKTRLNDKGGHFNGHPYKWWKSKIKFYK